MDCVGLRGKGGRRGVELSAEEEAGEAETRAADQGTDRRRADTVASREGDGRGNERQSKAQRLDAKDEVVREKEDEVSAALSRWGEAKL